MLICVTDARAGRVNNTAFQQAVTFQCSNLDVPIQWEVSQRTEKDAGKSPDLASHCLIKDFRLRCEIYLRGIICGYFCLLACLFCFKTVTP